MFGIDKKMLYIILGIMVLANIGRGRCRVTDDASDTSCRYNSNNIS